MKRIGWLLATGCLLAHTGSVLAGPGPMQVEEPELKGPKPPIQPEKDQAGWKERKSATLTPSQKDALKARQETMKDMVALIKQKRRALKEARPEDRNALALELHNLVLEKSQAPDRGRDRDARMESRREGGLDKADASDMDKNARLRDAQGGSRERLLEKQEEMLRQMQEEILRQQEARRNALEEKLKQLQDRINGNGSGSGKSDD